MNHAETIQKFMSLFFEIPVAFWYGDDQFLEQFEKRHVLIPQVQAVLTKSFLRPFLDEGSREVIYQFNDPLCMELVAFRLADCWVMLGPFTEEPWEDGQAEIVLADNGIPITHFAPYKLYRCSYQIMNSATVRRAALAAVETVEGRSSLLIQKIARSSGTAVPQLPDQHFFDYHMIQRRYQWENELIQMIQQGNAEAALKSWQKMEYMSEGIRFPINSWDGRIAGFAIIRTLCRKAAEAGGVSLLTVDAVSQKYAQKSYSVNNVASYEEMIQNFITEICDAVKDCRREAYSSMVHHAAEYIKLNLSHKLTVSDIAREVNVSASWLSKQFKKETGYTTSQYMADKRTEKAAKLLVSTCLSVQDISSYVGFLDNNYFVKVFKKQYQMTPTDYRKKFTLS